MSRLAMSLLGSVQITVDGEPLRVDTRKAIALLAWLALSPGRHSRDVLAALLWTETDQARAAFRRTLSTLHNALGQRWLAIARDSVELLPDDEVWIDVSEFRERAAAGDAGSLERALDLWRGEFMAGFSLRDSAEFDDWVMQQAESLRRDQADALERLVQQHCGQRQFEPAARYARRWLGIDALHEDAHRQLMRVYAWMGDRSAALHQYRECVRVLDAELGVPPLDETTALYELILEQRELPPPEPSVPAVAILETRRVTPATPTPSSVFPLVGRDEALERLAEAWRGSSARGRLGILHGEAGIGKTRLAEVLLGHASRSGAARISTRCYEGETSLAYGPFVEGLREALSTARGREAAARVPGPVLADVSRLLPELVADRIDLQLPAPLDSPGALARFYGSVLELLDALLAGEAPGILLLDDAQWLDAASLELISFVAHRLDRHPFLLLLAWRDDLVADDHRLRRIQVELARHDAVTSLALERLTRDDVRELFVGVSGTDDSTFVERLFNETEGLPFFLTEYLREVPVSWDVSGDGVSWSIPRGMRDMLRQRLAAVTPIESQLLTTLATAGRACSIDLLQEASGRRAEEALIAIEGLLARGLIVELVSTAGDGAVPLPLYAFSHEKMREMAYEDTSLARRMLVHRRIADALLASTRSSMAQQAAPQAALHYRLAGAYAEAALQYRIAGDMARDLYASVDALAQYQMALALGHPDAAAIQTAIGDQYTLLGRYDEAFVAYETAAALSAGAHLGVVEGKLGNLNQRLGHWERAEGHYEAAVEALSGGTSETGAGAGDLARLYADWSLVARRRGDAEEALARARQSFELASVAQDEWALARAHNLLGILARASGDLPAARAALDESLRIATRLGDNSGRMTALNNLALVHADLRDFERAIELAHEALEACVAIGDRHREAALRSNLADCYHGAGRLAESREQVAASARIYGEIGTVAGEPQPEDWKLTEW